MLALAAESGAQRGLGVMGIAARFFGPEGCLREKERVSGFDDVPFSRRWRRAGLIIGHGAGWVGAGIAGCERCGMWRR